MHEPRPDGDAGERDRAGYRPGHNVVWRALSRSYVGARVALLKLKHPGLSIGHHPEIDFARVRFDTWPGPIAIGDHCFIMGGDFMGLVYIGDWVQLVRPCRIGGSSKYKVTIGRGTWIAPNVYMVPVTHAFKRRDLSISEQGSVGGDIIVGEDCWIGMNSIISPGVTVGKGAVVGANSLVTTDVAEYAIVAGCPAKMIGQRT
jgi:acetyltransferase-like isoleucine patch superfamily enzyme